MTSCEHLRNRGGWTEDRALLRCAPPIGPRNTWSNAAYVLVGVAVALRLPGPASTVFAAAMVLLGVGSGLYHAYKTLWANRLDHGGIYMVTGSLSIHAIAPTHSATPYLMLLTGAGLATLFAYVIPRIDLDVQMGLLLFYSAVPSFLFGDVTMTVQAFGLFAVAFAAWHLDRRHSPLIGLWGHAVWHVLTAAAVGWMFLARVPPVSP